MRAFLRNLLGRPTATPAVITDSGARVVLEDGMELLPIRTPGLAAARRHTWTGVHHGLGALRAVHAWTDVRHDPARGSEADVQHTAAIHQLDTAVAELRAARRALTGRKPR